MLLTLSIDFSNYTRQHVSTKVAIFMLSDVTKCK